MTDQHWGPTISGDIVVIGGGSAGIGLLASLLKRDPDLNITLIEPSDHHCYQPAWTLVGGGAYDLKKTRRPLADVLPNGVTWVQAAVTGLLPDEHTLVLDSGQRVSWNNLIVCPGLRLAWEKIEGLQESLGQHGVTSNYSYQHAQYTWDQVQKLRGGKALFTQPAMPIKCAGAPQKALYLSCDWWRKEGVLKDIDVEFCSAGAVLFGVPTFVPPLMKYVEGYGVQLDFNTTLTAVDGPAHKAWFKQVDAAGNSQTIEKSFDFLHAVPAQRAPEFIRQSPLANADGWFEAEHETLRHPRFGNVFSLGDVCSAPNAKTAAAVRKQAPVVAENVLSVLKGSGPRAIYDGYGSCPLTVEHGKVILAEFGYGGKLLPTFPLDPKVPRRLAWKLKTQWMPSIYFEMMLKGHEWLAEPKHLDFEPRPAEAPDACDFTQEKKG